MMIDDFFRWNKSTKKKLGKNVFAVFNEVLSENIWIFFLMIDILNIFRLFEIKIKRSANKWLFGSWYI